jgi:hypothetical protein
MSKWYILDDENNPVPSTITDYVKWEEDNLEKRIVKQEYIGDIRVSTVFLGLDHAWIGETPILWETMIFGGEYDQYQVRYTSYDAALQGHEIALSLIKTNKDDEEII